MRLVIPRQRQRRHIINIQGLIASPDPQPALIHAHGTQVDDGGQSDRQDVPCAGPFEGWWPPNRSGGVQRDRHEDGVLPAEAGTDGALIVLKTTAGSWQVFRVLTMA